MSRPWRWLFVALALPVAAAHADPITVTTGAVVIVGPFGLARVDVRGTDGFILTGLSEIHGFGFLCNSDCSPGQLFDPAGNLNEFEGTARLTVQGHPRNVHVDDNNSSFNFFAVKTATRIQTLGHEGAAEAGPSVITAAWTRPSASVWPLPASPSSPESSALPWDASLQPFRPARQTVRMPPEASR